jgi:TRAP-type uncharacterized transport system substrate-binding protein
MISGRKRPSFGRQVELSLRPQGSSGWHARFLASDNPDGIDAVAARQADLAIINPSAVLTLAYRGTSIYRRPLPVRGITVLPQRDVVVLAVTADTGLAYLEEVAERRYPLRISLRGAEPGHSIHLALSDILAAAGCPLHAIESWGGQVHYDPGLSRLGGVAAGERDAIFEEAFPVWAEPALEAGMRFLSLRDETLDRLVRLGYRRATVTPDEYPALTEPLRTIDFSGWPLFCHAEASDELVERFCAGIEDRKERIPWEGPGPLPLERMCGNHPEAPLDVPLHPAAERFWRAQGYL